jgi:hypothetical protein
MSSTENENIRARLIRIILSITTDSRRFKALEETTHISAGTWRTFWNRNSGPSGEMIEAISIKCPQYAFYLATGITDPFAGHVAPPGTANLVEEKNDEIPEATNYFQYQLALSHQAKPTSMIGIDKSELENLQLMEKVAGLMPEGANVIETLKNTPLDLLNLESFSWSTEFLEAKAILKKRHADQQHERLEALRKAKMNLDLTKINDDQTS